MITKKIMFPIDLKSLSLAIQLCSAFYFYGWNRSLLLKLVGVAVFQYACRKALADSQPRIRGRFAKTEESEVSKRH